MLQSYEKKKTIKKLLDGLFHVFESTVIAFLVYVEYTLKETKYQVQ